MKITEIQRNMFSRIASVFLLFSLVLSPVAPLSAQVSEDNAEVAQLRVQLMRLDHVITIPRLVVDGKIVADLSQVDWQQKINVGGKQVQLNSREALDAIDLPSDIAGLVETYKREFDAINGTIFTLPSTKAKRLDLAVKGLQSAIASNLIKKGTLPTDYFEQKYRKTLITPDQFVNLSTAPINQVDASNAIEIDTKPEVTVSSVTYETIKQENLVERTIHGVTKAISDTISGAVEFVGDQLSAAGGILSQGQAEITNPTSGRVLINSVHDAQAWRKYLSERAEYMKSKKGLPANIVEQAEVSKSNFEDYLVSKQFIDVPGGKLKDPPMSVGKILMGAAKWVIAAVLPDTAYAYIFGKEDFESCGSLPCSFDVNNAWGSVTPSIDTTGKVVGTKSLKTVVTGQGGGSMGKSGLATSTMRAQFKVWVPNPVTWGASGYFSLVLFQDGSQTDTIWINVENYGTPRLTISGDVLPYTDTGLDLTAGAVNTIEMRFKIGSTTGDVDIWLNNSNQASPNYNGSGSMNTGTDNLDGILAGLVYAPENGISTIYVDDVIVSNAFIGSGANSSPTAPYTLWTESQTNPSSVSDSTPEFSAIYADPDAGDSANKYRIQVSTSSTFATIKWDSGTTSMATTTVGSRSPDVSYSGSALASSTTYYWRAAFTDASGAGGVWSTTTSTFILSAAGGGNAAPMAPTLLLTEGQSNPTSVTDTAPEFSAVFNDSDSGDSSTKYRLQVSTSASFSSFKWDSGTTTMATTTAGNRTPDISYAGSTLSTSTTYYWRIRFADIAGATGAWNVATSTFVIDAIAGNSTSTQAALQYLIDRQNTNGSWGTASTTFQTTVAVLDALYAYGETGTAYRTGVNWITFYDPDNTDYLAQQTELVARDGGATSTASEVASAIDGSSGGFSVKKNFESDPATTAKALQALTASLYRDDGASPSNTVSLALFYLTQTKRYDSGWNVLGGLGASPIAVTSEVVEALLPYRDQALSGFGPSIAINDTLNPALDSIKALQSSNGSWSNNVLNTAFAFYTLKKALTTPTYSHEAAAYLQSNQAVNGSWSNDLYTTAQALKALVIPETTVGDLTIDDIVPQTTLQNASSSIVSIDITNHGGSVVNTGILQVVAEDYVIASINFASSSISINPGATAHVNLTISNTVGLIGSVPFDVWVEGVGNNIYPNSRYKESLTFTEEPSHLPALPIYFGAQKNTLTPSNVAGIQWVWQQKSDSNRLNYEMMWRAMGSSTWSTYPITNSWSTVILSPFIEDQLYEVTMGSRAQDGTRLVYYTTPVQVKVSGNTGEYIAGSVSGTMNSILGKVPSLYMTTSGSNLYTDLNGNISLTSEPYGAWHIRANNYRYEDYSTLFTTADNAVTGFKAYTNLIPDTANPEILYLGIAGETDFTMENQEVKTIQVQVDDDIGISGTGVVDSVTFYYYEPADTQWHQIGVLTGPVIDVQTYQWDIPSSLLGSGYKIKAVARDFVGKESAAVEWGPFTLTAGNASPEFSFVTSLPVATSTVDLSYTVQYNSYDPDDNASVLLSYDPDKISGNANHTSIVTLNEDNPVQQYIWDTSNVTPGTYFMYAVVGDGGQNSYQSYYSPQAVIVATHTAPTAPGVLLAEGAANPTTVSDPTPEFSAIYKDPNTGDVASSYRIQVSATSSFETTYWDSGKVALASSTPKDSRVADISYSGGALASSTPYYWRIKFWDTSSNEGAFSTTTSGFTLQATVGNSPPNQPLQTKTEGQTNPAYLTDSTPEFSAIFSDPNPSDYSTKYRIQVSSASTFSSVYWDSGTSTMATTSAGVRSPDISYAGGPLASSTTYYWRILFIDNSGAIGPYAGSVNSFSLADANVSPSTPWGMFTEGITNPTNITDSTPEFSAIYRDTEFYDYSLKYRIQVSTSSTFASIKWDSGTSSMATTSINSRSPDISYAGSALASSTTYYWRILFIDSSTAASPYSTTTSTFTLSSAANSAPTAPSSLLSEGSTNPTNVTDSTPEFSAVVQDSNAGDSANKYRIQVSTSSSFTSVYWDSGTTTMATTSAAIRSPDISYAGSALASSTTYYWRIAFVDVGGLGSPYSTTTSTFSLAASAGSSTPTYIQSNKAHDATSVAFSSSVTSGNLVVVGITVFGQTLGSSNITDNKGNTYTKAVEAINGTDHAAIYYAKNVTGGSSFTVSSVADGTIAVHEYSGVNTTSPLDKVASSTGTSVTPSSGNVTTSTSSELYFGLAWSGGHNNTWTAGSGFTLRQTELNNNTYERLATEDRVISSGTTTAAKFTTSASNAWAAVIATFKP